MCMLTSLSASKSRSCPERMEEMPCLGNLSQFFWLLAKGLFQAYSLAPCAAGCMPPFSRLNPQLDASFPLLLNIETIHGFSRDGNRNFKCSLFSSEKAACLHGQIHGLLRPKPSVDSSLGRHLPVMSLSFCLGQIGRRDDLQPAGGIGTQAECPVNHVRSAGS